MRMHPVSYAHQFPLNVIQHAVWLCLRFQFSLRDVEDLLAERGLDVVFRWFVGLGVDDAVWDVTVFTKNCERLLEGKIAASFGDRRPHHPP